MTSPNERTSITLDYLKGKRRAEKALGFLTNIGPQLLACDTRRQVAQTVADYLIRLDISLCLLDHQPHAGSPVAATAWTPDLEHDVPNREEFVAQCRKVAERVAVTNAQPLEQSDTIFEIDSITVSLHQFALDYPSVGTGTLSVARLRTHTPEFTSAELALLADVSVRFLSAVRCLPA